jgi:hypothetical protein
MLSRLGPRTPACWPASPAHLAEAGSARSSRPLRGSRRRHRLHQFGRSQVDYRRDPQRRRRHDRELMQCGRRSNLNDQGQIMPDKLMKIPGPNHPISIEANPSRVVVTVGGKGIADTRAALTPAARRVRTILRHSHRRWCTSSADSDIDQPPPGGTKPDNSCATLTRTTRLLTTSSLQQSGPRSPRLLWLYPSSSNR